MELPPEFSSTSFNAKAWLNATLQTADSEAAVSELHTRLQMQSQELSSSLETVITQALSRLPRTAAEIERMSAEAAQLSTQLGAVIEETAPAVESVPNEIARLHELHKTKQKLAFCADVLQQANSLQARVDEVERAIASLGKDTAATSGSSSGAPLSMDTLAAKISAMQNSLATLQKIDPSYGQSIAQRVSSFESQMQESLERECLECLKKQEQVRAPKLLRTLRTIGRDNAVIDKYVNGAVQQRRHQFLTDLAAAPSSSVATIVGGYFRTVIKLVQKEEAYFAAILPDESTATATGTTSSTPSASSSAASRAVVAQLQKQLIGKVCDAIGDKLRNVSNNELVDTYATVRVLEQHSDAAAAEARTPFANLTSAFASRELDALLVVAERALDGSVSHVLTAIEASATRASKFFPNETLPACVKHWNRAIAVFASKALAEAPATATATAAAGGGLEALQRLFNALSKAQSLAREVAAFDTHLSVKLPAVAAVVSPGASTKALLVEGCAALEAIAAQRKDAIGVAITQPILAKLAGYEADACWNPPATASGRPGAAFSAGQVAPTERIRTVAEDVMELPLRFEGLGMVDGAEIQPWLALAVGIFVERFTAAISKVPIRTRHAIEQALADLEYTINVLMAISDATFEQLQDLLAAVQAANVDDCIASPTPVTIGQLVTNAKTAN